MGRIEGNPERSADDAGPRSRNELVLDGIPREDPTGSHAEKQARPGARRRKTPHDAGMVSSPGCQRPGAEDEQLDEGGTGTGGDRHADGKTSHHGQGKPSRTRASHPRGVEEDTGRQEDRDVKNRRTSHRAGKPGTAVDGGLNRPVHESSEKHRGGPSEGGQSASRA